MGIRYLHVLPMIVLLLKMLSSSSSKDHPINIFMQCNATRMGIRRMCAKLETKVDKLSVALGQTCKVNGKRYFNAAYGKRATQSSNILRNRHLASAVTNGLLQDFSHTNKENNPWLQIDLGKKYFVFEVEIYNVDKRVQCCAYRFHDANISVGPSLKVMELCGHFQGPGLDKERIVLRCSTVRRARYVKIQIVKGTGNYLQLAEALVWAINV